MHCFVVAYYSEEETEEEEVPLRSAATAMPLPSGGAGEVAAAAAAGDGRRNGDRWAVLVATVWIQALTGTNLDFSAYSSALKSSLGISQEALNYLATASDMGKALGWSSGLALQHMPLHAVLLVSAALGLAAYAVQYCCLVFFVNPTTTSSSLAIPYPLMADLLLTNIMPGPCNARICVRVSRFWDFYDPSNETKLLHSDMVLLDEEGNAMHAQVYPPFSDRFKECIKEGNVYNLSYFRARNSGTYYKPVANDQMLVFTKWTKIEEVMNIPPAFPLYAYSLASMDELQARMDGRGQFSDVMGIITAITGVGKAQTSMRQGETDKRNVTIHLQGNVILDVSLWSERATSFPAEEVHKAGQHSPQVVIFVGTLVKSYSGMSLSGGPSCKWYINPDVPEAKRLMASAKEIHKPITWTELAGSSAQKEAAEAKKISEFTDINPFECPKTEFLVTVTIKKIDSSWWYNACNKCKRTAKRYGDSYRCSYAKCSTIGAPQQRFKLCVLAGDETGDANFILFGKQAQQLIRKSADTLIAENPIGFIPDELTKLLERTYNWNVSFTDSTTDSGNVTLQVNVVLGRVTEDGGVLAATPAGSQASSIMLSPGPTTSVQSHAFALSPLRAASGASQASADTPARTTLPVLVVPDSPQSVKKIADEEVPVAAQGKDGSSKRTGSKKRSHPSPSKAVSKKLNLDAETEDGDVGSGRDENAADQLSPSNNA